MAEKLLFIASTRDHICHFHLPYLRQFKEDGWLVHVACGGTKGNIPYADSIVYLPFKKHMLSPGNFRAARDLRRQILRQRYSAVIVHTSLAAFFARIAVWGMKDRPVVINMVHGYLFDDRTPFLKRTILLAAEKLTASVTDLLITMNRCDYEIAKKHHLCGNVVSAPSVGVDFLRLESQRTGCPDMLRNSLNMKPDDFVLIYPAEFSDRKMQPVLLRAMTALPKDTVLVLPGAGKRLAACQKLAKKIGISRRVRFPGHVADIAPWYEMANAAVFSSRSEGLSFGMMEAMYFGLPVVASDVKGYTDLITDQKTGLLYPCGDWAACAGQIRCLMDDPELACTISQTAQENVKQYDLCNVQPQIMELYYQAIGKTAVGSALNFSGTDTKR